MSAPDLIVSKLADPEYLYLLIEPAFVWGVGLGTFGFLLGFLLKDSRFCLIALILVIASCAAAWPYGHFRAKAAPRVKALAAYSGGAAAMEAQSQRRADAQWAFYGVAALAALSLPGCRGGRPHLAFAAITLAAGLSGTLLGIYLDIKEREVVLPNLKTSVSPADA